MTEEMPPGRGTGAGPMDAAIIRGWWQRQQDAQWRAAAAQTMRWSAEPDWVPLPNEATPDLLIQATIITFGDKTNEGQLVEAVAIPWFAIIRELERNPNFLFEFDWRKMEELVAGAYKRQGCPQVELTPRSGDKGRDVIATWPGIGSIRIIDQVKAYRPGHKVPAKDVRELLGVLDVEQNVSKGIVTTTSTFAPGVEEEMKRFMPYRLELRTGPQLVEWLTVLMPPS